MHDIKALRSLALVGGIIGILFLISLFFSNTSWSIPFFGTYGGKKWFIRLKRTSFHEAP